MRSLAIVLIEDDFFVRPIIAELLQNLGHRVVKQAGTFQEGMEAGRNAQFDLAILDLNLHGQDARSIAEVIAARGMSVLLLTGQEHASFAEDLKKVSIVQKPCSYSSLRSAIERVVTG